MAIIFKDPTELITEVDLRSGGKDAAPYVAAAMKQGQEVLDMFKEQGDKNVLMAKDANTTALVADILSGKQVDMSQIDPYSVNGAEVTQAIADKQEFDAKELNRRDMLRLKELGNTQAYNADEKQKERDYEKARILAETTETIRKAKQPILDQELKAAKLTTNIAQGNLDDKTQQKAYAAEAARVAAMSYDDRENYFNDPANDEQMKLAVKGIWRKEPTLYGEANNDHNYSEKYQATVARSGTDGVPTLADEDAYTMVSKDIMSSDNDIHKKGMAIAREIDPEIDKVLPAFLIKDMAKELADKLGYEPSKLDQYAVVAGTIPRFWGNLFSSSSPIANSLNDDQVQLIGQLKDSLPEHSDKRRAATTLYLEAKETSLALKNGRSVVSAAQINRRLKEVQYGLSQRLKQYKSYNKTKSKKKSPENVTKAVKKRKSTAKTPAEVAKSITK